jgi:hypothetical protein
VAELFTLGKDIKFSTPAGTNITAKNENRKAYANTDLSHKPGQNARDSDNRGFYCPH